jgi:hypothetical protein
VFKNELFLLTDLLILTRKREISKITEATDAIRYSESKPEKPATPDTLESVKAENLRSEEKLPSTAVVKNINIAVNAIVKETKDVNALPLPSVVLPHNTANIGVTTSIGARFINIFFLLSTPLKAKVKLFNSNLEILPKQITKKQMIKIANIKIPLRVTAPAPLTAA